jgi:alpha-L-rhamnosidase
MATDRGGAAPERHARAGLVLIAALLVLAGLFVPLRPAAADGGIRLGGLTVDDRTNPLGIGGTRPHFGWVSTADRRGVVQSAYELRVGRAPGAGDVWSSGRVASPRQTAVTYDGPALSSGTRYHWQVRIWDGAGRTSGWSKPAWFETGLLTAADWAGADWLADQDAPLGWSDYAVDTEFTLKALVVGVFFRSADVGNGYLWQISVADGTGKPKLRLHRRTNGNWDLFAVLDISGTISQDQLLTGRHHFTISALGQTITTKVDGVQVDQRTRPDGIAGTFGYRVVNADQGQEKFVVHRATVTGADGATLADVTFADGRNPFTGGTVGADGLDLSTPAEVLYTERTGLPLFRKEFTVPAGKKVVGARAYGAAKGVYELSLNGEKVGDQELAPGWTDYRTRVQHQTYDVTKQLRPGANAFGIALAPGWYAGHLGNIPTPGVYGATPSAVAQLRIDYSDGTHDWIRTDTSWRTANGPFVRADRHLGETYDARLERRGWNRARYDHAGWVTPVRAESATALLVPQPDEPVRATQVLPTVSRTEPKAGTHIYDLGQNMVGVTRLRLTGTAGQTATIRHGEVLNPDGTLYTANLRSAEATDRYTFAADGTVEYEPTFTQHGFRYVEITGVTGPRASDVKGVVWGSDLRTTGAFSTSNPMLDKLQSNISWGQRGNFLSVPTDTPARDERLGWTGDINVFAPTASYNQDTRAFLRKWLGDLRSTQRGNGDYNSIAPDPRDDGGGGVGWSDSGITVPYALWHAYADTATVREHYPSMKRFFDFVRTGAGTDLIDDQRGRFHDWLNLDDPTSSGVLGTAYFAEDARMMSEMARAIGEDADADAYAALSGSIRAAFTAAFVAADGTVSGNSQTAYAMALGMNLVPGESRSAVADKFVAKIKASGGALTTGFLGTPWLLPALSGSGRMSEAYALLLRDQYPSWGYEVKMGATTMWERWNSINPDGTFGDPGMNSFNHYAYGAVGLWMYENIGGISALEAGYHKSRIAPHVGGGLTSGSGSFDSAYGPIRSSWHNDRKGFRLVVDVPVNTTAQVEIPATAAKSVTEGGSPVAKARGVTGASHQNGLLTVTVGSGHYEFRAPQAP